MSDDLLGRADSLMRRSRSFVAGHAAPAPVDDGIPLLTEAIDLDALIAVPEPEDRTAEITAQVTAEVTERVTAEVTAAVTDRVTADVTACRCAPGCFPATRPTSPRCRGSRMICARCGLAESSCRASGL